MPRKESGKWREKSEKIFLTFDRLVEKKEGDERKNSDIVEVQIVHSFRWIYSDMWEM